MNSCIANFLKELANNIDNLSEEQLQLVGEFYISYLFHQQKTVTTNVTNTSNVTNVTNVEKPSIHSSCGSEVLSEPQNDSDGDFLRFFIMGWYIYKMIADNRTL